MPELDEPMRSVLIGHHRFWPGATGIGATVVKHGHVSFGFLRQDPECVFLQGVEHILTDQLPLFLEFRHDRKIGQCTHAGGSDDGETLQWIQFAE